MNTFFTKIFVLFSFYTSCRSKMEPYIVGGNYARIEKFPHALYLWVTHADDTWICGGSIVNQHIMLTAAHCLNECTGDWSVNVYAGSDSVSHMTYARPVHKYVVHRAYIPSTSSNDIALGYMSKSLPLGQTCKRVILRRDYGYVTNAEVAGWGMVDDQTQEDTDQLKSVKQNVQSRRSCRRVGGIERGMMCAVNNVRNRPSKGDSGSALVTNSGQQIGLVSFRKTNMPEVVVYSNVSYYYDWITEVSRMLYCSDKKRNN